MRRRALTLLACPSCGREVDLAEGKTAPDGHVLEGLLACAGCAATYAIRGGVPYLAPDAVDEAALATADRFGEQWKTFDHMSDYQEGWLKGWLDPLGPDDFRGQTVFEGGCGKGRHTVVMAQWGAKDIVSLDLGSAVDVAFAHTRDLANVHIVQGDLMQPPTKKAFDMAFSIGVLHHLPDPRAGFDALCSSVMPGGRVAIWVYGYESNEWIVRYVNPLRRSVTSKLPQSLLYYITSPAAALLSAASKRWPAGLPYADYMKQLATLPRREVHNIVFDQLVTPLAFYLREDEVRVWFDHVELTDVQMHWHNGNSWRASARVRK